MTVLDQARPSNKIVRVYPHKRLCDFVQCLIYADGRALYKDGDHLSGAGVNLVLPEFEQVFETKVAQRQALPGRDGTGLGLMGEGQRASNLHGVCLGLPSQMK